VSKSDRINSRLKKLLQPLHPLGDLGVIIEIEERISGREFR